jgi:hypothetical protein
MKTLLVILALTRAADTTSSLTAFHHGAQEGNPLVISAKPAPFVAQMAAETVGQVYLIHALNQRGHPKWARAIALVQISASSGATAWNAIVVQRQFQFGR